MSWIWLDDLVAVIHEAIFDSQLVGPVNATAPNPVTNREFVKTLGNVLRRPTVVALPGAVVKMVFGEMGEKLLLVPGHCDPTVNLYDWYVCTRRGVVEALWPITARGAVY